MFDNNCTKRFLQNQKHLFQEISQQRARDSFNIIYSPQMGIGGWLGLPLPPQLSEHLDQGVQFRHPP